MFEIGKACKVVQKEFNRAFDRGVRSTPTMYVNDYKIVGVKSFAHYRKIINEELKNTHPGNSQR